MSVTGMTQTAYSSDSPSDNGPLVVRIGEQPDRLNRFDRVGLVVLAAVFVLFSGLVQYRSALYPPRRLGDWNVFARAAWAARTGGDLYAIADDNGFHYLYPPTFAILLAPLADAPAGAPRAGLLPYPLTVLYWYFFNLTCLALAAHWLASVLEEATRRCGDVRPLVSRRWWGLRVWPVLACLPPIGHTLMRGQVGVLLLLFLSGMIANVVRGRGARAGGWLACAICLKVIPALLLVYPLLRRDRRFLAGCGLGLLAGLVVIPVAARGPRQAWADYRQWNQVMLAPAFGGNDDTSRASEVLDVTATDSQSFLAMLHNTIHLDRPTRPRQASRPVRFAALVMSAAALASLILAWRRCGRDNLLATAVFLSALIEVMLLASPVCHLHYFCLSAPLIAVLLANAWRHSASPKFGLPMAVLTAVNLAANTVPHFPGMEVSRDIGLAGYSAVLLITISVVILWRRPQAQPRELPHTAGGLKAAA
jgi:alpha-1,2-mannosyltransferase